MCGIVGLFLKNPALEPALGSMLSGMLEAMTDRGPDSAGMAIYGPAAEGRTKLTLRGPDLEDLPERLCADLRTPVEGRRFDTHLVLQMPDAAETSVRAWLAIRRPDLLLFGAGRRMELFKETGLPAEVARRFALAERGGTHGIGHTRMATESAVTTAGAHPFSTGRDQCLVHNGSLSNHNSLRRRLIRDGLRFATENDSEVAAGYLTWAMAQGADLGQALEGALDALDGFFTFVVGTETGFAVLRDPIGCKPAVMAETPDYVAFGSEYRALAGLPGIECAMVFEPEPARVYRWERH